MLHFKSALLIALLGLFCACGQTGPLVLPDESPDSATAASQE